LLRGKEKGFMKENMSNREMIELIFQSINKKEFEIAFELLSEDIGYLLWNLFYLSDVDLV
jgi:hypothetical protein